jgi:hypothetical protein
MTELQNTLTGNLGNHKMFSARPRESLSEICLEPKEQIPQFKDVKIYDFIFLIIAININNLRLTIIWRMNLINGCQINIFTLNSDSPC